MGPVASLVASSGCVRREPAPVSAPRYRPRVWLDHL